ncbi:MAG TPA: hypothetical protein VJM33_14125 [Microthrixaceae bacterium]|nr:hypothetical protein [Microthrixaceae bacterium]
MAIRPATSDDVDSMVDVAAASRFAHQAWEPELWASLSSEVGLQPVLMRAHLASGRSVSLVSESHGEVDGWIRARPTVDRRSWVVDELAVTDARHWHTTGRALLVAIAGRARGAGAGGLHLATPRADVARVVMLEESGLAPVAAVRHRVIGNRPEQPPKGVRALVEADIAEVDLLLDGSPRVAESLGAGPDDGGDQHGLVVDDGVGVGAVAIVRSTDRRATPVVGGRAVAVAEPMSVGAVDDWTTTGDRLLEGVEWLAARRGVRHVLVPCALGDSEKERALDLRSYGWPLDVWCLRW